MAREIGFPGVCNSLQFICRANSSKRVLQCTYKFSLSYRALNCSQTSRAHGRALWKSCFAADVLHCDCGQISPKIRKGNNNCIVLAWASLHWPLTNVTRFVGHWVTLDQWETDESGKSVRTIDIAMSLFYCSSLQLRRSFQIFILKYPSAVHFTCRTRKAECRSWRSLSG